MTYNKALFVYLSGITITITILFCLVFKLFFLESFICGLVLFQICLLEYTIILTIAEILDKRELQ